MGNIGSTSLLIVPKFDNLSGTINKALGSADGKVSTSAGTRMGQNTAKGFGKGFAIAGAVSGVVSRAVDGAISTVSSHVDSAVKRLDTLNLFPKTMQSLGYSSKEASQWVNYMSDRLQALPTRLDDMVTTVKGISVITKDLGKATKAGLALNDMLIASGANQQIATAAAEQFRQMLSKGKPDMQDWKSLMQAMPGQLDQLAKAMLGPTAGANDLYEALGGGKHQQTISMDQLLDAMIKLDLEGGSHLTSFKEQAETAAGGIETQMANTSNAITRGLADTLKAIGNENISGMFSGLKKGISDAFKTVNSYIPSIVGILKTIAPVFADLAPKVAIGVAAFMGLRKVSSVVSNVIETIGKLNSGLGFILNLPSMLNPVTLGLAAVASVVGVVGGSMLAAKHEQDKLTKSYGSFADEVKRTGDLGTYFTVSDSIKKQSELAKYSLDDLRNSFEKHAETMKANNDEAENTIGTLTQIQRVIDSTVKKTDLSAEENGKLEWALKTLSDQYGINISKSDVLAGKYTDENGQVQDLAKSIDNLVAAKKKEARINAASKNLTEAYSAQTEALKTYNSAYSAYLKQKEEAYQREKEEGYNAEYYVNQLGYKSVEEGIKGQAEKDEQVRKLKKDADEAKGALDSANTSVKDLERSMGDAASGAADLMNTIAGFGSKAIDSMANVGLDVNQLSEALVNAGISTQQLESLGTDMFSALVTASNGSVSEMVKSIQNLNALGIDPKEFTVTDDGTIQDQAGNVWDFNAMTINGKHYEVNDDGTISAAELGIDHVSAKSIRDKYFSVVAEDHATSTINHVLGMLSQVSGVFTAHLHANASGGIRANAAGGVRYHADGAIATKAAPLDIVGEAGAEAIVPLTNRRYSQPFADIIAEGVTNRLNNFDIAAWLNGNLPRLIAEGAPVTVVSEREEKRRIREMMVNA